MAVDDVIKTENGRWQLDCGCVLIVWEIYDGKYHSDCAIEYCPMHAAAHVAKQGARHMDSGRINKGVTVCTYVNSGKEVQKAQEKDML